MKCHIACLETDDTPYESCMITPMTMGHFASGIGSFVVPLMFFPYTYDKKYFWSIVISAILHFIYELKDIFGTYDSGIITEWVYEFNKWLYKLTGAGEISEKGLQNSWQNSVFDFIFGMIGTMIAYFVIREYAHVNRIYIFIYSAYIVLALVEITKCIRE